MVPIILIGFQNSGKTTLAKLISQETKQPFLDTDCFLSQKLGKPVRDIYKEVGEKRFRELEHQALQFAHQNMIPIVSTGGGTPINLPNQQLIKKSGTTFYLKWAFEHLKKRSNNPGFITNTSLEEIFIVREPVYKKISDFVIDMHTYQSIHDIKNTVLKYSQLG